MGVAEADAFVGVTPFAVFAAVVEAEEKVFAGDDEGVAVAKAPVEFASGNGQAFEP